MGDWLTLFGGMAKRGLQLKDEERQFNYQMNLITEKAMADKLATQLAGNTGTRFKLKGPQGKSFSYISNFDATTDQVDWAYDILSQVSSKAQTKSGAWVAEAFNDPEQWANNPQIGTLRSIILRDQIDKSKNECTDTIYTWQNFSGSPGYDSNLRPFYTGIEEEYAPMTAVPQTTEEWLDSRKRTSELNPQNPHLNAAAKDLAPHLFYYKANNYVNNNESLSPISNILFNKVYDRADDLLTPNINESAFRYNANLGNFNEFAANTGSIFQTLDHEGRLIIKNEFYDNETAVDWGKKSDNSGANQAVWNFAQEAGFLLLGKEVRQGDEWVKVEDGLNLGTGFQRIGQFIDGLTNPEYGFTSQLQNLASLNQENYEATLSKTADQWKAEGQDLKSALDVEVGKGDFIDGFMDSLGGVQMTVGEGLRAYADLAAGKEIYVGEGKKKTKASKLYKLQAIQIAMAFQMAIALQGYQGGKAVSDADFLRGWQAITGGQSQGFWSILTPASASAPAMEAALESVSMNEVYNIGYLNAPRGARAQNAKLMQELVRIEAARTGETSSVVGARLVFTNPNVRVAGIGLLGDDSAIKELKLEHSKFNTVRIANLNVKKN